MANSAFDFESATGGGGVGGVSRQLATFASILRNKKSSSSGSLSAKDTAGFMDKQHVQGVERAVVDHLLNEKSAAANRTHLEGMQAAKLGHEATQKENDRAHQVKMAGAAYEAAQNPNIRAFDSSKGSFTTTHPMQKSSQFDGVGED